jgi:hypothetical protein
MDHLREAHHGVSRGGVPLSADILVVYKKNFEAVHDRAMVRIEADLSALVAERGIRVEFTAREKVRHSDFIGRDLVIVVGGDGTLTSIAHNVGADTPVMGVNSHPMRDDPDGSYGFFMGSDPDNFAADVVVALDGGAIDNDLPRLQAEIVTTSGNRIKCDPALNDLLISNTHQYQPSRYRLQREADTTNPTLDITQRSSGCLFSTFVGQGAWFRHIANIEGTTFPRNEAEDHYLFVSRELPRSERKLPGEYTAWTDQATLMTSDMHRGYVVSDGWDETHFTRGAVISVSMNGPRLHLLTFRERIVDKLTHWLSD